jgi:hypothetical protein
MDGLFFFFISNYMDKKVGLTFIIYYVNNKIEFI